MKRHYNRNLFWAGFLINLFRLFFIVIPALILVIVGIWVRPCLFIGLGLLAIALIIAFIQQLAIKRTAETSDNPNFEPFAEAMCSDDWREKIDELVNERIKDQTEGDGDKTGEDEAPDQ